MTFEEVSNYYVTGYNFHKSTGMSHANFVSWKQKGYVPICTQIKLEKMTNGALKASLDHMK